MNLAKILWVVVAAQGAAGDGNLHYAGNQAPLKPTPFVSLPLGSVQADGWLRQQLELQRRGLTGRAEQVYEEIGPTSAWRGGDKENWEKTPYYVKGLIPLAYTLDDDGLKRRAQVWVDWILSSQREDGFYGPASNDDWWPRMVSNYFLRDYFEATGDPRVLPVLTKYYRYMLTNLPKRPLKDWGKSRAGDDMDTAVWLYNRTKEPFLLEVVDLLRKQAYDWPAIMHTNGFHAFGNDFQPKHNVNVPQAMKMPAVSWQRTGDPQERSAIDEGQRFLMRDHGLSVGMASGTEFLAGRSPSQGVEFCSVVEQMLSDETVLRIFGEGRYADHLELIAFNALPAAWNRDLTGFRYYSLANHVIAQRGPLGFGQNYDNGAVYGPRSGFPCCCFNAHQGWPKLVQNSWGATDDNGLVPLIYGPTTVTAKVGVTGATATIREETYYPFEDVVRFKLTLSQPTTFPLALRTPQWCESAKLTVNGQPIEAARAGEFAKVLREWRTGDEVVLTLPMKARLQNGVHGSVSVLRGPLLYTLAIKPEPRVVDQPAAGFHEVEFRPASAWNYALVLDPNRPSFDGSSSVSVDQAQPPASTANPFDPEATPVKLHAKARRVPDWGLAWNGNASLDPPFSPVVTDEPVETVTLVPFGSRNLRLTDFPVAGSQTHVSPRELRFDFHDSDPSAWSWFGGGWWAQDGKLRTAGNGGIPGYKALIDNATFRDMELSADVMPAERGDAGLIVRVGKPSIGPDAFQGYYGGIDANEGVVKIGKMDGRHWTELRRVSRAIPRGQAQRLRFVAVGDRLELWIGDDRSPALTAKDSTWTAGQVGVRLYSTDSDRSFATFDNVLVKSIDVN